MQTGLTQRRINQLVAEGALPGIRIGNINAIDRHSPALARLKRLKKSKENGNAKD